MAGAGQKVRRDSSATRAPPTQNTPAITCAPGRVKGTDSARGFGCQTRAVIVVDVGGPRFCWLCCGEIYCGGKGVVGDMARRVGAGGEPVGVFHIEVDSKRTLTNQKVRHPKMQDRSKRGPPALAPGSWVLSFIAVTFPIAAKLIGYIKCRPTNNSSRTTRNIKESPRFPLASFAKDANSLCQ